VAAPVAVEDPAASPPAFPPPTSASPPPTFLVERIVVEGVRHGSEPIVVSETLLALGQEYTEAELREALQRVERLPFVVEAELSLRRGTARGRFDLVIRVVETMPLFGGGELNVSMSSSSQWPSSPLPPPAVTWSAWLRPQLGARVFWRGQHELSATAAWDTSVRYFSSESLKPRPAVTYRHYNLFGRHVVGSVSLGATSWSDGGLSGSGELVFPLSPTSVLRAGVLGSRYSSSFEPLTPDLPRLESRHRTTQATLRWESDSTDDPFTPREGRRLRASVAYSWSADHQWQIVLPPEGASEIDWQLMDLDGAGGGASLSGDWYKPLTRRLSAGLGAAASASRWDTDGTVSHGDAVGAGSSRNRSAGALVRATLSHQFWSRPGRVTRCWWELSGSLGASWSEGESDLPWPAYGRDSRSASLDAAVAARGRWGTARISFAYRHWFRAPVMAP
jgi:hypothetical protein